MNDSSAVFFQALEGRIERYDLLKHPFYQAWSKGELTREDLREYASEYWHHVSAFPAYLSTLHSQLPDGKLRRVLLENLADEEGLEDGRPHSEMWMDFARGMGAPEAEVRERNVSNETRAMLAHFRAEMHNSPATALAALYTYESRVPAIAKTKADGLKQHYGADDRTRRYFTVHTTADVHHARVWRNALSEELLKHPEQTEAALSAAEDAARVLWTALDGVEAARQARMSTVA
jgi:pyrroloquinoline-quinone synthase